MSFYTFTKIEVPGPAGYTLSFTNNADNTLQEVATVDGQTFVWAPTDAIIPEQPSEIIWAATTVTDAQTEQLKATSPQVKMIADEMQRKIREVYSPEDEQYFSRIGVGVALGAYSFQPGEEAALLKFGDFVESVRRWGRTQRAAIGL